MNEIAKIVKANVEIAKNKINNKKRAENIIESFLNELSLELENKIEFKIDSIVDSDLDIVYRVWAVNKLTKNQEITFTYYFNQESIFPLMLNYQNTILARCGDIDEVYDYLKELFSDESFMIKIVLISEMNISNEDNIPF